MRTYKYKNAENEDFWKKYPQLFHPKHVVRKNMLDMWMAFLKDPLNNEIQDVNEVRQALDTLKEVSEDEEALEIYYLIQQTEFGYISEKNVAVEKAHKSGERRR